MREQVESILAKHPVARWNDLYLVLLWLKLYGGIDILPFIPIEKIASLSGKVESVLRARRLIQNVKGKYRRYEL